MKYLLFLSLLPVSFLIAPKTAVARIGESRSSLESRLFDNGGVVYRNKDGHKEHQKSGPYSDFMKYLGSSAAVQVYFKSDDGSKPLLNDFKNNTLGTGWELHVLYVSGKSVFELYKRIGSFSEYETHALLGALADGNYWEKVDKNKGAAVSAAPDAAAAAVEVADAEEVDEDDLTVFGFDYLRSDGDVRAKKSGGELVVFQKQLDIYLAKQRESLLMQSAPQSVQGF